MGSEMCIRDSATTVLPQLKFAMCLRCCKVFSAFVTTDGVVLVLRRYQRDAQGRHILGVSVRCENAWPDV